MTLRYSPLGWSQWLYGPLMIVGGVLLGMAWKSEIVHRVENSGRVLESLSDWINAAACFSSSCSGGELALGVVMWGVFLCVALVLVAAGVLFMSFDQTSIVSLNDIALHRGRIFAWHHETFAPKDIEWTIERAPILMVIGNRVSQAGFRWRIVATIRRSQSRRSLRRVMTVKNTEAEAQHVLSEIRSMLGDV